MFEETDLALKLVHVSVLLKSPNPGKWRTEWRQVKACSLEDALDKAARMPEVHQVYTATLVLPPHERGPKAGTTWHRAHSRGMGFVINHPAETRHVMDRTYGGDVIFVSGRYTRNASLEKCTLADWIDWAESDVRKAKLVRK